MIFGIFVVSVFTLEVILSRNVNLTGMGWVYTKPWQAKEQVRLMPDSDIFEAACENNRDLEHLGGKLSR